jgi:thiamine-phosphate pyrophosphorylase
MKRRQSMPTDWLISDERFGDALLPTIARLPPGSGVLVRHHSLSAGERARLLRQLRRIAAGRNLVLVDGAGRLAARVHNPKEIARARLAGAKLLLLSPVFATRSHPGWRPLPRMRLAALARLAGRPLIAIGGMNPARFRRVQDLGFDAWAGIDAWVRGLR